MDTHPSPVALSVLATLLCIFLTAVGHPFMRAMNPLSGAAPEFGLAGVPTGLTIALPEAFAISFEALLLYLLARKTLALSVGQAVLTSFVMDVSSFLAGLTISSWL